MKLYILGDESCAHELFEHTFLKNNKHTFGGFITLNGDEAFIISTEGVNKFNYSKDSAFILGVLSKECRQLYIEHFSNFYDLNTVHFPNIYSNTSHISYTAAIGFGNVFAPYSSVNGITNLGNFNYLGNYASIYNSTKIEDNNILYPYASIMEHCTIGNNNYFDQNSTITKKINIGNDNIVTAGECVFDSMNNKELFQSGIILSIKTKET